MSYDVYLEIDTGNGNMAEVYWVNMTSNVAPMWRLEMGPDAIRGLHGRLAGDCIDELVVGLAHMQNEQNRPHYEALNPSNGWGNYEGATQFVADLLAACRAHPNCVIRVWY